MARRAPRRGYETGAATEICRGRHYHLNVSEQSPDRAHQDDAAARLLATLRHYLWVVALLVTCGAAAGVASALLGSDTDQYEASALVIAKDVPSRGDARILAEQLPRLGEAVFTAGSVADRAVAFGTLPFTREQLIPDHAVLEPLEGTIVLRVKGIADDPGLAAMIANRVAATFVSELNRAGPGVGHFAIQDRARPPDEPVAGTSAATLIGIGLGGGLMLALALVALIMVVRRPVLSAADAEDASGVRILAAVDLPVGARGVVDPQRVVGLGALARRLVGGDRRICAFVSIGRAEGQRSQLAVLVAQALAPSGPVALVAPDAESAERQLGEEDVTVVDAFENVAVAESKSVVIDGPSIDRVDVHQVLPPAAGVALVIRSGTARAAVEDAVGQLVEDELLGLVFVRRRLLRGWRDNRVMRARAVQSQEVQPADSPPSRTLAPVREPRANSLRRGGRVSRR
jgi:capsular polysaccharide biosynthesis protein